MDNNIEKMLQDILQNQLNMQNQLTDLQNDFSGMKNELMKHGLIQEKILKDIQTIAEVQQNHIKMNETQHEEMMEPIENRFCIIEKAIIHNAKEANDKLNQIYDDIKFIKHKEFQNEESLFKLKEHIKLVK